MEHSSQLLKGVLDMCLLALISEEPSYGYEMVDKLQHRGLALVSEGSIYPLLSRLQKKGFLTSALGSPTPERGGKAKRIFSLQAEGRAALRASLDGIREMLSGTEEGLALGWSV